MACQALVSRSAILADSRFGIVFAFPVRHQSNRNLASTEVPIMRARRRRSVMNTISAAVLEVAIMGIFVIIAQPQLRDALFEIMHVDPAPAATGLANLNNQRHSQSSSSGTDRATIDSATIDRTVQAVVNSPVGRAVENSLHQWATGTSASSTLRDQSGEKNVAANYLAGYSPFDQYEAFRVNVPANAPATTQYVVPHYVPHKTTATTTAIQLRTSCQNFNGQNFNGQNYNNQNLNAQNYNNQHYAPTQLNANQWNIASANQTVHPNTNTNTNTNNWMPTHATETSYRQVYPPPYGTQSMWK